MPRAVGSAQAPATRLPSGRRTAQNMSVSVYCIEPAPDWGLHGASASLPVNAAFVPSVRVATLKSRRIPRTHAGPAGRHRRPSTHEPRPFHRVYVASASTTLPPDVVASALQPSSAETCSRPRCEFTELHFVGSAPALPARICRLPARPPSAQQHKPVQHVQLGPSGLQWVLLHEGHRGIP